MSAIALVVEFNIRPAHLAEFIAVMQAHAKESRKEPGCLQFKLVTTTAAMDYRVFLFEEWKDQDALDWHLKHSKLDDTRRKYDGWVFTRQITHCAVVEAT